MFSVLNFSILILSVEKFLRMSLPWDKSAYFHLRGIQRNQRAINDGYIFIPSDPKLVPLFDAEQNRNFQK